MPDVARLLTLKRDHEIKKAVVNNLGRTIEIREGLGGLYDHHPLREVIVGLDLEAGKQVLEQLPTNTPWKEDAQSIDLLCAEVMEFCPVPLAHWQQWARHSLEDHRKQWLSELVKVRKELKDAPMFAIPFGRFASASESPEQWVSGLQQVDLNPDEAFENWDETAQSVFTPARIWYFTRPYIIWPLESPEALHFVTRLNGNMVRIKRPSLNQIAPQMTVDIAPNPEALPREDSNQRPG